MKTFRTYMIGKGYATASVDSYQKAIQFFIDWMKEELIVLSKLSHTDLIEFVSHLQKKRSITNTTINSYLIGIQHFLSYNGLSIDAIKSIRIRGKRKRSMIAHVLEQEKLLALYENYSTHTIQRKRNKVILGFIIFQALPTKDIACLTIEDINITKGVVRIRGTKTSNGRVLQLHSQQILSLHTYMNEDRTKLLTGLQRQDVGTLFFTMGTSSANLFSYLSRQLREMDMGFISFHQLRASVFNHWLKQYNLRQVQHMAGHKYVSSTERFIDQSLSDLEDNLEKFHPMG